MELCEWDPERNQPAEEVKGEWHHGCPNPATWIIGRGMRNWHLCESCSKLPRFKRFRVRQYRGERP